MSQSPRDSRITRGDLLRKGAGVGAAASVYGVTAAAQGRRLGPARTNPKRGGTIHWVASDFYSGEKTDPATSQEANDLVLDCSLWDAQLTWLQPDWSVIPWATTSWSSTP